MTSFNKSFQLSPYSVSNAINHIQLTLPLGGFVNHKVHLFCRGCFTLKLSLSWNTVTGLSLSFASVASPPFGEMGIVERSTCLSIAGTSDTAAAMITSAR